jgi:hypothetical protein
MEGWNGQIKLEDIGYWVNNRRTDVQITQLKKQLGLRTNQVPDNDQLFEWLEGDPELDVERLARDILFNGLRQQLIISYDNVLLDGNRRYLAHRWIAEHGDPHQRERFNKLNAWILTEECSDEAGKLRIITQYNFLDDFRKEWNNFVKAKLLWEEYNDGNKKYTYSDLFAIYGGPGFGKSKITEYIKTYEVILLYAQTCPDEDEALVKAAENFVWFEQLQRSYRDLIRDDEEFQEAIFDNIRNEDITKTDDLKNLIQMRRDYKEAWKLFKKGDIEAAHTVRKSLELEEKKRPNPDALMDEINARLERLLAQEGLAEDISEDAGKKFHELARQIPGQISDVNMRVAYIVKMLQAVSSIELAAVSKKSLSDLQEALTRVIQQAQATQ